MAFASRTRAALPLAVVILAMAAVHSARADVYTVGPTAAGCGFATIQQALDRAQSHPGADTVRITRAANHVQQKVRATVTEDVNIVGGFADCASAATDNIHTRVSGTNGAPVFYLAIASGARVKMRHLDITGGVNGGSYGGGIYFTGAGALEIMESTLVGNSARYGGGIYAKGAGPQAMLEIGQDVFVSHNQATASGGGIYADSVSMTMTKPGAAIVSNEAPSGWGGGLKVLGDTYPGRAWLSSGYFALYGNLAKYGGGLAIEGRNGKSAKVYVYTTDPNQPTAISGNEALEYGGGVYAEPGHSLVEEAVLLAWNVNIESNLAGDGAALYLDGGGADRAAARFNFNSAVTGEAVEPAPAGSVNCSTLVACNQIRKNEVHVSTPGSQRCILCAEGRSSFALRRASLREHQAGFLLHARHFSGENGGPIILADSLVADNHVAAILGNFAESPALPVRTRIEGVTIAGNTWPYPSASLLRAAEIELRHSIIWQPGRSVLSSNATTVDARHVLANDLSGMPAHPSLFDADPRFLDAEHGDYRLHAASPAVDFGEAYAGTDLTGAPRGVDLATPDAFGPTDLGAYERQFLAPLLRNGHFDAQLNGWRIPDLVNLTWSHENAPNSIGGSAQADAPASDGARTVATQCVFLPAPGRYVLSGHGRAVDEGQAQADAVQLGWNLRRSANADDSCGSGTLMGYGDVVLSNAGTTQWTGESATIDVPPSLWTPDSSMLVFLRVVDRGNVEPRRAKGRFDAIVLDYQPPTDDIFTDGFDLGARVDGRAPPQ